MVFGIINGHPFTTALIFAPECPALNSITSVTLVVSEGLIDIDPESTFWGRSSFSAALVSVTDS